MNLGQMLSFIGQPPPSTPMPNEFGMSAGGGGGGDPAEHIGVAP